MGHGPRAYGRYAEGRGANVMTLVSATPVEGTMSLATGVKDAFGLVRLGGIGDIIARVNRAGYGVATGEADLVIKRLSDDNDARRLEKALLSLEGVLEARARGASRRAAEQAIELARAIKPVLIGREGRQSPINTMRALVQQHHRSPAWVLIGWSGVVAGFLILSYYVVIAGWALLQQKQVEPRIAQQARAEILSAARVSGGPGVPI